MLYYVLEGLLVTLNGLAFVKCHSFPYSLLSIYLGLATILISEVVSSYVMVEAGDRGYKEAGLLKHNLRIIEILVPNKFHRSGDINCHFNIHLKKKVPNSSTCYSP